MQPTRQREQARARLTYLLSVRGPLDVVEAGMWVAAEEYPDLDVRTAIATTRHLVGEGAARAAGLANPFARLEALRGFFFDELGFRGNTEQYEDPRNSYLNEVIERRLGIPLTLGVLFMELAAGAGFSVRGIGLPGHFACRLGIDGRSILIDPFDRGRVVTEEDCRQLVARSTGRPSLFRRELLEGIEGRATLVRMLLNLKHVYLRQADYRRALAVVERLLLVRPDDPDEVRDRGFLQAHLGRPAAAIADLESYLALAPRARDAASVRGRLGWLRRRERGPAAS